MQQSGACGIGVLLLGYGGPRSIDEVETFLFEIMGHMPSEAICEKVRRRYLAIGGCSPLPQLAQEFADALLESLKDAGLQIPVVVGFRYSQPTITSSLRGMYASGVRRIITVSLSPFEAAITTVAYRRCMAETLADLPGMEWIETPLMGGISGYVHAHSAELSAVLLELDQPEGGCPIILFSAHSLPVVDMTSREDSYVLGLRKACDGVAECVGLPTGGSTSLHGFDVYGSTSGDKPWMLVFQSRGQRPGEWLGPSMEEVLDRLIDSGGSPIIVCPVGFALENMETMYDLDVEIANRILASDREYMRSSAPNSHPALISAISRMICDIALGKTESKEGLV